MCFFHPCLFRGSDQQDSIATRLGELEEELSALRTSFSNLDLNFQALSTNLKSCCGNSNVDLAGIRTYVNQILTQVHLFYVLISQVLCMSQKSVVILPCYIAMFPDLEFTLDQHLKTALASLD